MAFVAKITKEIEYRIYECGECQAPIALSEDHYERAQADSNVGFFCSKGHRRVFNASKVQILEKELAAEKQRCKAALGESNRLREELRATEESKERELADAARRAKAARRRQAAGLCPCCKRSFKQLRAHLAAKHPEFVALAAKHPEFVAPHNAAALDCILTKKKVVKK